MSMNNLLVQGVEPRASSTTTPAEISMSPWPPMWSKALCRAASICAHRRRDGRYTWDVPAWCVRVTLPFTSSLMPCWPSQEITILLASHSERSSVRSTARRTMSAGRRPAWHTVHGLYSNGFFFVCAVVAGTGVYYASPCPCDDDTASTTHCHALLAPTAIFTEGSRAPRVAQGSHQSQHQAAAWWTTNVPRALPKVVHVPD